MRPLKIYIETSVFGFILDDTEVNRTKREATERLFDQLSDGRLDGFVSRLVLAELLDTPDPKSREILLSKARSLGVLPQPDSQEFDLLVDLYMKKGAFPAEKRDDAEHVALMVIHAGLDAMVSWNCRHLANENNRRYLRALTLAEGYAFNFDIVTPEGVLVYG